MDLQSCSVPRWNPPTASTTTSFLPGRSVGSRQAVAPDRLGKYAPKMADSASSTSQLMLDRATQTRPQKDSLPRHRFGKEGGLP